MNESATARLFGMTVAALTAVLLAAGCAAPTSDPAAPEGAGPSNTLAVGHVHGLGVDPADGRVYVAGHHGLCRRRR